MSNTPAGGPLPDEIVSGDTTIRFEEAPGMKEGMIVRTAGVLDLEVLGWFSLAVLIAADAGRVRVVMDCANVKDKGVVAIGVLATASKMLAHRGGGLVLFALSPTFAESVWMSECGTVLPIRATLEEAMQHLTDDREMEEIFGFMREPAAPTAKPNPLRASPQPAREPPVGGTARNPRLGPDVDPARCPAREVSGALASDLREAFSFMDQLLEQLDEELIGTFAHSESFRGYRWLFEKLGVDLPTQGQPTESPETSSTSLSQAESQVLAEVIADIDWFVARLPEETRAEFADSAEADLWDRIRAEFGAV